MGFAPITRLVVAMKGLTESPLLTVGIFINLVWL